jgi:hypothetical protein
LQRYAAERDGGAVVEVDGFYAQHGNSRPRG